MGRKRIELASAIEAQIAARTARCESATTIYEALGRVVSVSTIARRQNELKGKTPSIASVQVAPSDAPEDVPESIPDSAQPEDLDRWIKRLEKGAAKAEADGNLAALASIAAKVTALYALKHKSQPLPKPDPSENPDMKELAAKGRERLLKLAKGLFGVG